MRYHLILANDASGLLDERVVECSDDPELTQAVIDFIGEAESLRDGDVIRIAEIKRKRS